MTVAIPSIGNREWEWDKCSGPEERMKKQRIEKIVILQTDMGL
jgi:hypothetical protein